MTNALKRLPTGIQTFEKIIEGDYLYVDKTALVYQLTHEETSRAAHQPGHYQGWHS